MIAAVLTAVVVVLLAVFLIPSKRSTSPPDLEWWKTSIVYQIYPRSFMDSDNDGVGDLRGIINKLDYFPYLNVKAIWISPVFESPMKDFGYDISNFTNIDPIYGNLTDMTELIKEAHERDIRVIIDLVPNHTSNKHFWFVQSENNVTEYRDYYVWSDGKVDGSGHVVPPNNWVSKFRNSAWEWSEKRQQFYFHAYLKEQPDLNYRNQHVRKQMKDVLRFWLDAGVDGFRIDALSKLFESKDLSLDEPPSKKPGFDATDYRSLKHVYTRNLMGEITPVLAEWRQVLDEYQNKDSKSRMMLVEAETMTQAEQKAWFITAADMTFYFGLTRFNTSCGGTCISRLVNTGYEDLGDDVWPNFVLGNHDKRRVATRKGRQFRDVLNMLLLTLRGTPTTYYGEEIGMEDVLPTFSQAVDPKGTVYGPKEYLKYSRDPERSPMQWSATYQAGFSNSSSTWLPVGSNFREINVQTEKTSPGFSTLKLYQRLARLRTEPAFSHGSLRDVLVNDNIFSYLRHTDGFPAYLIILNVGNSTSTCNYSDAPVYSTRGVVAACTQNSGYNVDDVIELSDVTLETAQGLVIKL